MKTKKLQDFLLKWFAGSPALVKIDPVSVLNSRETYQGWNMMLALTWGVQIMCVMVMFLTDPHTALHGHWIFGAAAVGGFASARLTVEIMLVQAEVDKVIFERDRSDRATMFRAFRKAIMEQQTAGSAICQIMPVMFTLLMYEHHADHKVAEWIIASTAAATCFLPVASCFRYFQLRPMERRVLIGR